MRPAVAGSGWRFDGRWRKLNGWELAVCEYVRGEFDGFDWTGSDVAPASGVGLQAFRR